MKDMKDMKEGNKASARFDSFDSTRGIGVIIVILYHMGYDIAKNAWFVISLFFSCSGFLITKVTYESYERHGQVNIIKFWAKRISRLFPALLLTLVTISLSQMFRVDDGVSFQRERTDLFYAAAFATNINLVYNKKYDYTLMNLQLHQSLDTYGLSLSKSNIISFGPWLSGFS